MFRKKFVATTAVRWNETPLFRKLHAIFTMSYLTTTTGASLPCLPTSFFRCILPKFDHIDPQRLRDFMQLYYQHKDRTDRTYKLIPATLLTKYQRTEQRLTNTPVWFRKKLAEFVQAKCSPSYFKIPENQITLNEIYTEVLNFFKQLVNHHGKMIVYLQTISTINPKPKTYIAHCIQIKISQSTPKTYSIYDPYINKEQSLDSYEAFCIWMSLLVQHHQELSNKIPYMGAHVYQYNSTI